MHAEVGNGFLERSNAGFGSAALINDAVFISRFRDNFPETAKERAKTDPAALRFPSAASSPVTPAPRRP
ncbi:hypothetical protein V2S84_19425, partial [Azotobacter chroococcum]|nr:hypothetical protein [Azotobacter chroococcum]